MDRNNSNIDDLLLFINDTRQGKYTEETFSIDQIPNVQYEYEVFEDINRVSDSVILYGLSY